MQYDSNNLLVVVLEIGLEWQKIAPIRIKNVTMEFWKLLCLFMFIHNLHNKNN